MLTQHYVECPKYPVDCEYDCGEVVAREEMEEHISLQGTCLNCPLECEFHDIGCEFRGRRQELCRHVQTNSTGHIHLVLTEMQGMKHKMQEMKRKLDYMERELSDESKQRKLGMPPGQFIYTWKIDNWQQRVDNSEVNNLITSRPFYVDPGYRMVIKAYLGGQRDEHFVSDIGVIGLYLCLDCSLDDQVNRPFSRSFTLAVVDQQLDGQDISKTASSRSASRYIAGPTSSRAGWPSSRGAGWASFASYEQLHTRHYVKEDTVIIRLSVKL
jgi:TNF receptor-associated factor 4